MSHFHDPAAEVHDSQGLTCACPRCDGEDERTVQTCPLCNGREYISADTLDGLVTCDGCQAYAWQTPDGIYVDDDGDYWCAECADDTYGLHLVEEK